MTAEPGAVDLVTLGRWMDDQGLEPGAEIVDVERIAGGTQNVLLRFRRGARTFVLRRPPPHKRANSDETMRREARVLAALAGTDVPHPALIAACGDEAVLGAAFYLMEPVTGFNPTTGLPEPHRSDPDRQRAIGLSMADGIAAVGRVDVRAVGLGDFGKPDGWLERQVDRWRSHLASYDAMEGYAGPAGIPDVDRVATWLEARRPARWTAGLIHGDFHFANVLVHPEEGRLAAIVDWELATLGDPLLDLGHLLATWPSQESPMPLPGSAAGALPSREEVIARYAAGSTRPVDDVDWYQVLACYRLGIILEGTHARAAAGLAPAAVGDLLHAHTVSLFEQAHRLIDAAP